MRSQAYQSDAFKVGKTGNWAFICEECLQGYDILEGRPERVSDEELVIVKK
ncbi:MAG: hypothetical protein QXJ68_02490 [Methanocellales archaeon]